jgi:hypothetical protein
MTDKLRTCPECGTEFAAPKKQGKARVFCCDAHKQAHANRMTVRGKQLAKIALGWRQTRGGGDLGKFLFGEMTSMLDDWNAEDLKAGRMKAGDYAALVCEFNTQNPSWSSRYFDRKTVRRTKQEA